MTTLQAVPLLKRTRSAWEVVHANPGMEVEERMELLILALWPDPVPVPDVPDSMKRHGQPFTPDQRAQLQAQVYAMRDDGTSASEIARRIGVSKTVVLDWLNSR